MILPKDYTTTPESEIIAVKKLHLSNDRSRASRWREQVLTFGAPRWARDGLSRVFTTRARFCSDARTRKLRTSVPTDSADERLERISSSSCPFCPLLSSP